MALLSDIPTPELRKAIRGTEDAAGRQSKSARILRRELKRRKRVVTMTAEEMIEQLREYVPHAEVFIMDSRGLVAVDSLCGGSEPFTIDIHGRDIENDEDE